MYKILSHSVYTQAQSYVIEPILWDTCVWLILFFIFKPLKIKNKYLIEII